MDRLVKRDGVRLRCDGLAEIMTALARLADYEDTGLTPAEIEQLKAENARLHKPVDNIECIMKGEQQ